MTQMMMKRRRMWRLPTVQKVSRKRKKLDPDDFLLEGKRVAEPGSQTAGLLQTMPCCVSTCLITSSTFCSGVSPPSVHILCVSKIYFIGVGGGIWAGPLSTFCVSVSHLFRPQTKSLSGKKQQLQKGRKSRKQESSGDEDEDEDDDDDDEEDDDEEDTPKRQTRRRGATKVKRWLVSTECLWWFLPKKRLASIFYFFIFTFWFLTFYKVDYNVPSFIAGVAFYKKKDSTQWTASVLQQYPCFQAVQLLTTNFSQTDTNIFTLSSLV